MSIQFVEVVDCHLYRRFVVCGDDDDDRGYSNRRKSMRVTGRVSGCGVDDFNICINPKTVF